MKNDKRKKEILGKWMYHTGNHFLSIIPFS